MKVVLLAGGYGTRLSELTETIPKPMVSIGGRPILHHIIDIYYKYGHKEFIICCGYKSEVIKKYFSEYLNIRNDFTIDYNNNEITTHNQSNLDLKITLVDTGENTMTGGRIKRVKDYINGERFLLTYGDGVCDININNLINYHNKNKKIGTVTAVRPIARFGEIEFNDNLVSNFAEKSQVNIGWINGGFFVFENEFLDYIKCDETVLEKDPLEELTKIGQLNAYKHEGFWQCMDTKRDKDYLENLIENNEKKW